MSERLLICTLLFAVGLMFMYLSFKAKDPYDGNAFSAFSMIILLIGVLLSSILFFIPGCLQ